MLYFLYRAQSRVDFVHEAFEMIYNLNEGKKIGKLRKTSAFFQHSLSKASHANFTRIRAKPISTENFCKSFREKSSDLKTNRFESTKIDIKFAIIQFFGEWDELSSIGEKHFKKLWHLIQLAMELFWWVQTRVGFSDECFEMIVQGSEVSTNATNLKCGKVD